jgi:hypothetical protein
MFFTSALGELGPQGRTAQMAISGIAGAIMGGGGTLAALSLAQVGARLLADAWGDTTEKSRAFAASQKSMWAEIEAARIKGMVGVGLDTDTWVEQQVKTATAVIATKVAEKTEELRVVEKDTKEAIRKKDTAGLAELMSKKNQVQHDLEQLQAEKEDQEREAREAAKSEAARRGAIATGSAFYQAQAQLVQQFHAQEKALRRDAEASGQDERTAIRTRLQQQIDDLKAFGQDDARTRAAINNARIIAAAKIKAIDQAEEKARQDYLTSAVDASLTERQRIEMEYLRKMATIREDDTVQQTAAWSIRNAKITALEKTEYEKRYANFYDHLNKKARAYEKNTQEMEASQKAFDDFMQKSYVDFATGALNAFKPVLTYSAAYSKAMKAAGKDTAANADLSASAFAAMTQEFLANLAMQAGAKAIFEIAEGYVDLGTPGMQMFAPAHFTAAANYGIVAGLAGAGAMVIGATRGLTKAEQAQVSGGSSSSGSVSGISGGAREYGSSGSSSGKTVTVRETVFVIGDPFESPAETARRAARTMDLAKRLDMQRRAG